MSCNLCKYYNFCDDYLFLGVRRARYAFELHLFHVGLSGYDGTCHIKLNDVLTLRQSNFEMSSGVLVTY